jgi:hypothetical protein
MTIRPRNILIAVAAAFLVGGGVFVFFDMQAVERVMKRHEALHASGSAGAATRRAPTTDAGPAATPAESAPSPSAYPWLARRDAANTIATRIPPPARFRRAATCEGTFARWLRFLPLKPGRPPVMLFDGREKANQTAHVAVVDMDVGRTDLQQCADTIMRLRAEYLYGAGRHDRIRFHFTNGEAAEYAKWMQGYRPAVSGVAVRWARTAHAADTYASLRAYLDKVFTYAGTLSLARELQPVAAVGDMEIGDVFIRGGAPGHAVIVVDLAVQPGTGRKAFLLAQGFMPAQEAHVLKNPNDAKLSPWYAVDAAATAAAAAALQTPEYTFAPGSLRRFPNGDLRE